MSFFTIIQYTHAKITLAGFCGSRLKKKKTSSGSTYSAVNFANSWVILNIYFPPLNTGLKQRFRSFTQTLRNPFVLVFLQTPAETFHRQRAESTQKQTFSIFACMFSFTGILNDLALPLTSGLSLDSTQVSLSLSVNNFQFICGDYFRRVWCESQRDISSLDFKVI